MREADHETVVLALDLEWGAVFVQPGHLEGHCQGSIDPSSPEGMEDDPPFLLARIVLRQVLDQEVTPMGQGSPGRGALTVEQLDQPNRRALRHAVLLA